MARPRPASGPLRSAWQTVAVGGLAANAAFVIAKLVAQIARRATPSGSADWMLTAHG